MSAPRSKAQEIAESVMLAYGRQLGLVIVIVADEAPAGGPEMATGGLEIDGATVAGLFYSERGAAMARDFSQRLRPLVHQAAAEVAAAHDSVKIDRVDLELHVTGERPKA